MFRVFFVWPDKTAVCKHHSGHLSLVVGTERGGRGEGGVGSNMSPDRNHALYAPYMSNFDDLCIFFNTSALAFTSKTLNITHTHTHI